MKTLRIKLTFTEDCLGTASNNPELHSEYIASKAPDAKSKAEEIEAIGTEDYEEKQMTVFPRDEDGDPIMFDYQLRGFMKEACSMLKRCPGEAHSKHSCKLKAYKKIIDGLIQATRKIKIHLGDSMGELQRPLRAQTAQGERVALAHSETVPAGSYMEFEVTCMSDAFVEPVLEWLNYGKWHGLGQWRNASWGRFTYEVLEMYDGEPRAA